MPGIGSISQVLSKDFIIGLGSNTTTAGAATSLSGGSSSPTEKVTLGLRRGASLYAAAIQRMNNVGTILNVADGLLEQLGELTDKAISIATRASKSSTSNSTRNRLNAEFQKLGNEFRELISEAKLDDDDILTKEGLESIFTETGLDPSKAKGLASLFGSFLFPEEENVLASEEIQGDRPLNFSGLSAGPTTYSNEVQVSNDDGGNAVGTVVISRGYTLYVDDDDEVGGNPSSVDLPLIVDDNGGTSETIESTPSGAVSLLNASETSGYSVVVSDEDFLGHNGSGVDQLFLMDTDGTVLHQYTDFTTAQAITAADLSSDGKTVTLTSDGDLTGGNGDNSSEVFLIEVSTAFGAAPDSADYTQVSNDYAASHATFISEDGSHIGYSGAVGGDDLAIYRVSDGAEGTLNATGDSYTPYGFVDSDTILAIPTAGADVDDLFTIDFANGVDALSASKVFEGSANYADHAVSEAGIAAFDDESSDELRTVDVSNGLTTSTTLIDSYGASDSIAAISLANNGDGTVDIGVRATYTASDANNEVYRYRARTSSTGVKQAAEVDEIFDGTIRRQGDAIRTLEDLTALREQIDENTGVIDELREYLQENIDLVRATGLAFLEVSDRINTASQADEVARSVEREIRKSIGAAELAHSENLSPIAAAALVNLQTATSS